MELTSKLLLEIQDFIPSNSLSGLPLSVLCEKYSQETSLQSDPSHPVEIWLQGGAFWLLDHPFSTKALICSLGFSRTGFSCAERYEKILLHISKVARAHGFQGEWFNVGELLQQDLFTRGIYGILEIATRNMDEWTFYGNFLPQIYLILERCLKIRPLLEQDKSWFQNKKERLKGIPRKIRRRGYNDKGSRRPSHKCIEESDWERDLKYSEFLEKIKEVNKPPKSPPPRYYYRSTFPEIGQRDSIEVERRRLAYELERENRVQSEFTQISKREER